MCGEAFMPKIAIVVPVFNVELYLRECLDSILAQSHKNFTVFVVDDGSTDSSGKIIDEYASKDKRIIGLHQGRNAGLGATRNYALDIIEKDGSYAYIAFVDSDDILQPCFLERLVNTSLQFHSDICVCGYFSLTDNGREKTTGTFHPLKTFDREEFVELVFSTQRWMGCCGAGGMVWKALFKSSTLNSVRFPIDRNICEDEIFCLQAASHSDTFSFVPEALYGYRQRADSLIRDINFNQKLLLGRSLCITVAGNISKVASLVAASAFAGLAVSMFFDLKTFPNFDLNPYKAIVLSAAESGLVSQKAYKRFLLLCGSPIRAKAYLFKRRIMKALKFRKRNK